MSTLDAIDQQLLALLQADARLGYRELGRTVGMSPPAVAARVRRLEHSGVITGYGARVDPIAAGHEVHAFVVVTTAGRRQSLELARMAAARPTILEDHRVTGTEDHVLRVVAPRIRDLEPLIDDLNGLGKPATSIVLSSPKPWAPVPSPEADGPPPISPGRPAARART
ncbi:MULTISPECIES: Lrp/AsnC family transcriptional regulator [Pseudonocardia]|nr:MULTISPECIES: Lrp/AsnC family transcriptional regulator [Pseudonocardia]